MHLSRVEEFGLNDQESGRGVGYRVGPTGHYLAPMFGRETDGDDTRPRVIAVRLDIDGWLETVVVDEDIQSGVPLDELDRAIAALTSARAELARMTSSGEQPMPVGGEG